MSEQQEEVLETSERVALQKLLVSQQRAKAGARMNERVLAQIATGHELDGWTTQAIRRLKWTIPPLILGCTLCYWGLNWQEKRTTAAMSSYLSAVRMSQQNVSVSQPPNLPPGFFVGDKPQYLPPNSLPVVYDKAGRAYVTGGSQKERKKR